MIGYQFYSCSTFHFAFHIIVMDWPFWDILFNFALRASHAIIPSVSFIVYCSIVSSIDSDSSAGLEFIDFSSPPECFICGTCRTPLASAVEWSLWTPSSRTPIVRSSCMHDVIVFLSHSINEAAHTHTVCADVSLYFKLSFKYFYFKLILYFGYSNTILFCFNSLSNYCQEEWDHPLISCNVHTFIRFGNSISTCIL